MPNLNFTHALIACFCVLLPACNKAPSTEGSISVEAALAECQSAVEGAVGINAKNISEKDAAAGYTISGFVLTRCMEKHRYRCTQKAADAPCAWSPIN
jgi:hypothetical protein